jgi:hypothetical protein
MAEEPEVRTQSAIAKALSVSQPTVSAWVNGDSRPKPRYWGPLHRLTRGRAHRGGWQTAEENSAEHSIKPLCRAG